MNPADWIDGSKAVPWGRWRWPLEIFRDIQEWGEANACRFLLVSEFPSEGASELDLVLYVAPKPNRRETGLCEHSVANRNRHLPTFDSFFHGFLVGRGLIKPGDRVR